MKKKTWVEVVKNDEFQTEMLTVLVEERNNDVFDEKLFLAFQNAGIVCIPEIDVLIELLDQCGERLDTLGFTNNRQTDTMLSEGFLIPSFSVLGEFLFFVNYDWERDKSKKYINAYPTEMQATLGKFKIFGADDLGKGIQRGTLYVTEGMFDRLRLTAMGLPACCTMGAELSDYHKLFFNRCPQIVYIGDSDATGQKSFQKFRTYVPRTMQEKVPNREKDIDDFAKNYPEDFEEYVNLLKTKYEKPTSITVEE